MTKIHDEKNEVINLTRELFIDDTSFITDKHIDEGRIKKYEKVLELLEKRREHWALNMELSPIDSIKIYGAYSTVYNTLYGVAKALDLGVRNKENPRAAKDVYSILQEATELIPKLERVHFEEDKSKIPTQLIAEIFDNTRLLRKQAISRQIIQAGEIPNREELIKELACEIETQLN